MVGRRGPGQRELAGRPSGKAIGIMQSGRALGYILAAMVSAFVIPRFGWRWLFAAGALPAILVLWISRKSQSPP